MSALTIGSLFAGIGGLELGLERGIGNGARTIWQVEQSEYCRAVLAKHWPDAIRYDDVRTVGRSTLAPVDVLCGGFPCQDISDAGTRVGIGGARSGLWSEYARIVGELRPEYVVVENVAALLVRGFGSVLGDLAALGYDAEWECIPAAAVGAPHIRDRVFILAYRPSAALARTGGERRVLADAARGGQRADQDHAHGPAQRDGVTDAQRGGPAVADSDGDDGRSRRPRRSDSGGARQPLAIGPLQALSDAGGRGCDSGFATASPGESEGPARDAERHAAWYATEPDVGRVAHGVPARVDRLRALGNAVVPQVAEVVGRLIAEREALLAESAA